MILESTSEEVFHLKKICTNMNPNSRTLNHKKKEIKNEYKQKDRRIGRCEDKCEE